jgi:hypothetical protein
MTVFEFISKPRTNEPQRFILHPDHLAAGPNAYGAIGYDLKEWLSTNAGFRATGTDYQNRALHWDTAMYGPIVGFDLRF